MTGSERRARLEVRLAGLVGLALSAAVTAAAGPDALERCAAIDPPDSRLACYDALAGRPASTSAATSANRTVSPASVAAEAAAQVPPSGRQTFGLRNIEPRAAPTGPASIEAIVARLTQNRLGQAQVLLDNGQTWLVDAADLGLGAGDKVTIKRASLGSYLMSTPSHRSYRVLRTQ